MNELALSVVIPTYNRAKLVARAVRSALESCRPGDEVIVVDDGSKDETEQALRPFGDRIRYVRIPNGGAGKARNRGVAEAKNPLVAFLDSDDEWFPWGIERKRALLQAREDVLFCFSDFAVRDRHGVEHRRYLINWHEDPRSWDDILGPGAPFSALAPLPAGAPDVPVHIGSLYVPEMAANYVFTSTLVVRRDKAGEAFWFGEGISFHEDWECFGRLARAGNAAYLDCETAWQHGHEGPRLTSVGELKTATSRLIVLDRVWGQDPAFMAEHGDRYRSVVREQRQAKIRALISTGDLAAARSEIAQAETVPLVYRFLASAPGGVTRALLRLRELAKKIVNRRSSESSPDEPSPAPSDRGGPR